MAKWFSSDMFYNVYTVVVTCYRNGEKWQEFWQLERERWTARETRMIFNDLHDKAVKHKCRMVSARVYYGSISDFEYRGDLIMRFRTSVYNGVVRDVYANVSGSLYNPQKRFNRYWARPYELGIR